MNARQRITEALLAARLYSPIHRIRAATVSRQAAKDCAAMRGFYAKLLPKGSLVFDIGANVGAFSEALASIGARVVALEPNADNARNIQLMHPHVQVIQAAAGSRNTLANLNVSDNWDCTCTLSSDWMEKMQKSDARYKNNWSRQIAVPVLTLDTLIGHFGEPYYIKIDTDGYDLEVLRGLSKQPALLSFEFNVRFPEISLPSLDLAIFAKDSRFNMIHNPAWGYPTQFRFADWISREDMRQVLTNLPGGDDQGDIYVARVD